MIKQDYLFLGHFNSLLKTNFPFSLSVSDLYNSIEDGSLPLVSLNTIERVNKYKEIIKEAANLIDVIEDITNSPASIEVEIEKKVRKRCLFKVYKTVKEIVNVYDIHENAMVVDLVNKIYWLLTSIQDAGIFEIKVLNTLFTNCGSKEHGFDNFRKVNRLYDGKLLRNVLDTNLDSREIKEALPGLIEKYDSLLKKLSKYYKETYELNESKIISEDSRYAACYKLINEFKNLNLDNKIDKNQMASLYKEYILSLFIYILLKHNYSSDGDMYIYELIEGKKVYRDLEFKNDIFTVMIQNYRPLSFDVVFKIRNNVELEIANEDLMEVISKMDDSQISYDGKFLRTKDAVKGPLVRKFVETCKELYGSQEKIELIKIYNALNDALIEESECCLKLNIKSLIQEKEVLKNKDLSKITINSAVNNIYNDYDSTIVVTPCKIEPTVHYSKINLNTFTLQNNILSITTTNIDIIDKIERILNEATILIEGNNQIYKEICPLCGSTHIRKKETGEFTCEDCESIYSANSVNKTDTIWLKRIRLK